MRRLRVLGFAAFGAALLAIALTRPPAAETALPAEVAIPSHFETPPVRPDAAAEASLLRLARGVSVSASAPPPPSRAPATPPLELGARVAAAPPTAVPEPPLAALALVLAASLHARACLRRAR